MQCCWDGNFYACFALLDIKISIYDIRKLPKQSVDMAFNAVSEIAKGRNTRSTTGDAQRPNMGMTSIASLNKQNADFWSNRKG